MTTGVGLLGCGAIGQELARAIQVGEAGGAYLAALFDQVEELAASVAEGLGGEVLGTDSMGDFLAAPGLDLVVECASPQAVRAHAETVLSAGKDLLMMSSGALADPELAERLAGLAQRRQRRLIVPSGALGGIDAIRAARGRLDRVTLTTTKPPRGLAGAPGFAEWESREISEPTVVFDGPAVEAVKLFPANVNVAATLSLAGLGAQETRVKVVADPGSTQSQVNVHEVEADHHLDVHPRSQGSADFALVVGGMTAFVLRIPEPRASLVGLGTLRFRMELLPHERNPKTSFLAIVSAVEALRAATTPGIRVGT